MSNFLNKIPVSPITSLGSPSIPNDSTIGTNFSILQTGGYMEIYLLSGLTYTIPPSTTGVIEFSGNSIPIQFIKGTGAVFSPDVLILNSDNISSGRRKLGMLSYVYETNKIYQFNIDNYDTLWNNVTGATGPGGATVVISDYGTTVKNNSAAGIAFINAWTASTISGVGGYNDTNASWGVLSTGGTFTGGTVTGATIFTGGLTANTISATTYQNLPQDIFVTGGTYSNSIATFTNNTGGTFNVTGLTTPFTGGTVSGATIFTDGLTANTISATTYQNLPATPFLPLSGGTIDGNLIVTGDTSLQSLTATTISATTYQNLPATPFLPLSGGTVTGDTIFTSGLTANTISATTYQNLPQDIFVTGGTYTSGNAIFTNNAGGTFTVTGFSVGSGGGEVFYLNLSESEGSNRLLSTTGSTSSQQTSGVTISSGVTSSIASFQSQQLNTILIPGGVWSFHLHSYKEDLNASFDIFVEVYKITSGGTQTLLFQTEPTIVLTNSPSPSMQISEAYFSGTSLVVSDSVVTTVRATNTGNQSKMITFVTEGTIYYSYVITTLPTQPGLTCDTLSGCSIIQTIQVDINNKFDKSGGTINGNLIVTGDTVLQSLTATTISATTYQNLPATPFLPLSGGTVTGPVIIKSNITPLIITTDNYSPGTSGNILFYGDITGSTNGKSISSRSNGGGNPGDLILQELGNGNVGVNTNVVNPILNFNLDVNGTFGATSVSATTYFNLPPTPFLPLSGGTVTGATIFTNGLTADTISATTYQNLPATPFLPLSGGTVTGATIFTGNLSANTISATTISGGTVVLNSTNLPSTLIAVSAFTDDYNRVTLSPGGSPSLTYTNTNTGAGNATITASTYLNIANGNPAGQSYTTVPLSGFNSPFNPTLSLNTGTIEWSFNLRTNRNTIFPGFSAGTYGAAVVLAGTSGTLLNTGNGYALVYGGTGTRNWRLVRYTSGLFGTRTDIISGGVFAAGTNYVSARIVYTPSTNTWTYYFRDDGAVAWGDPTTVTTLIGSAVDSTYTSSLMSSLGVFFNYATAANQNLQFDNLVVKLNSPSVFTPQSYLTLKNYANTSVFDVKDDGSVTSTGLISSTGGISGTTISGGTYFGNGSSLTLGQFGTMITGSTSILVTNATTTLTLIPGLTTTITATTETMVCIQTNGGVNTVGTTTTSGSAIDVALVVDGNILPNGGYQRMYADNPTGNATVTNWVANWNMSVIITLSAGIHTVEVDTATVQGQNATVSGGFGAINQGTLTIMILKNT